MLLTLGIVIGTFAAATPFARLQAGRDRPTLALQVGPNDLLSSLVFTPDGKTLATVSLDGMVRLYDTDSRQIKALLQGHAEAVEMLAFSSDGRTVVTAGEEYENHEITVRLWDALNGHPKATLRVPLYVEPLYPEHPLALSPDGETVAAAGDKGTVRLWDALRGNLEATLKGHTDWVEKVLFSPDGRILASGDGDATVKLWDVRSRQLKVTLQNTRLRGFFSPDSKTLVTSNYASLQLWDTETGHLKLTLQGKGHSPFALSPDSETLATWDSDRVRLWDLHGGQLQPTLQGQESDLVSRLAFSPDGKTLASGSQDGPTRLWDVRSGQLKLTVLDGGPFAFSPDGNTLATGSFDCNAKLWDISSGKLKATILQGHRVHIASVLVSPDGKTLATTATEGNWIHPTIRLWDARSGQLKATLQWQGSKDWSPVEAMAFSPDGKMLAIGAPDKTVLLCDAKSSRPNATLRGDTDRVVLLAFSADGKTLATGSRDGMARLWDARTGHLKRTLPFRTLPFKNGSEWSWALAISPDGKAAATAGWDGAVRLWDARSGQLRASLPGYKGDVKKMLAFSPDGKVLAEADEGCAVNLWDVKSRKLMATVHGDIEQSLSAFAFSRDGVILATACWQLRQSDGKTENRVRLWNARSGQPKATLHGRLGWVSALAFSRDGKELATGVRSTDQRDGAVLRWNVATGMPLPITSQTRWTAFPPEITHPVSTLGAAVSLHDPRDGRVLATLLSLPTGAAKGTAARRIAVGATAVNGEWITFTPEGYFDGSANAPGFIRWNVAGVLYPAERYLRRFHRPDLVQKALRGERIVSWS
jgi:WD40 repeat protein